MSQHSFFILFVLFILGGCSEVLRQPELPLVDVETVEADVEYEVTVYEAAPEIMKTANQSEFVRYVNVGGLNSGPVSRVEEQTLFLGPKPLSNQKLPYMLTVGDTVLVSRTGNIIIANGIQTRQTTQTSYRIDEQGKITLNEGIDVYLNGLTISDATLTLRRALDSAGLSEGNPLQERLFPTSEPDAYRLGPGDVIRVGRLIEQIDSNGVPRQSIINFQSDVGADGIVSILQLGDLMVAGLTLPQVRDRVIEEAVRTASGADILVEIEAYRSQYMLISGDLGTKVVPITDQLQTYNKVIANMNPPFDGNRDYVVTLERDGQKYQMLASRILETTDNYYLFNGDNLKVSELLPASDAELRVEDLGEKSITYLRVRDGDGQAGKSVQLGFTGLDLRRLLITENIDVNYDEDLLIRLNRQGRTYNLSAQSVVLNDPNRRYWLAPDDHIVVEDIAYVGDTALLVGEVRAPQRLSLNRQSRTTLSEALFSGRAFNTNDADFRHIYVLRGDGLVFDAYHFDMTQVLNLSLAEQFELRPGDIVFIRTRPISRYNRVLSLALTFAGRIDTAVDNVENLE